MNPWMPTIVTGVLVLLGWAVTYGTLTQAVKNNADDVKEVKADLKEHKAEIWTRVTKSEINIARIKQEIGINGEHGKSHHA